MRKSDTVERSHTRSGSRLYEADGQWFVRTREGDRGPFRSAERAADELDLYVATMSYLETHARELPRIDPKNVWLIDIGLQTTFL